MPRKKKSAKSSVKYPEAIESINPLEGLVLRDEPVAYTAETPRRGEKEKTGLTELTGLKNSSDNNPENPVHPVSNSPSGSALAPAYSDAAHGIYLYQNNCLAVLDAIAAKYPEGRFDMIFADPPYFLSNGGITCHAGKMVAVHKGDWDKSQGAEENHNFNREWLLRCQRVLKPNGTIWVSGTHHVIFSVGFAMQQLGFKILNDIAWEKPNPPPNLSCRYFTHSTETILWAAKNDKSKHLFNYQEMRKVTGKQMKTVWRKEEFNAETPSRGEEGKTGFTGLTGLKNVAENPPENHVHPVNPVSNVWTMTAPGNDEKKFGKHPTQKPLALIERCLLASTRAGDCVLDPFLGGGTTAVAALRTGRHFVGIELDAAHLNLAARRSDREIIEIILRSIRVRVEINVIAQNDLDLFCGTINGSRDMSDKPATQTERIFHETKFVFLSCAQVSEAAVVHTTVDINIQEAWEHAPKKTKCETTHIVRCETEIYRVKAS